MDAYNAYTDMELVAMLKQGDQLAFTEIYERYAPKLYYQVNQMLRNSASTKDLLQELFITIWSKAENINVKGNLAGYLYIAAQNSVLKRMRKGRLQIDYLESLSELAEELEEEEGRDYDIDLMYQLIENEISKLPEKMRQIFEMSRRGDLSYKDIAAELDIAENTVRKQVSNALKIIRGSAEKHGRTSLVVLALLHR